MRGVHCDEEPQLVVVPVPLPGCWTNTIPGAWAAPSRNAAARSLNRFRGNAGWESLADTPEVLNVVLGVLLKTPERLFVPRAMRPSCSPEWRYETTGRLPGPALPPGTALAVQEPLEAPGALERFPGVVEATPPADPWHNALHGFRFVALDPLQAAHQGRLPQVCERINAARGEGGLRRGPVVCSTVPSRCAGLLSMPTGRAALMA
jgi:hypothetical protein